MNQNSFLPIFNSVSVTENSSPSPVVTVSATDADDAATNDNGVIEYSIYGKQFIT